MARAGTRAAGATAALALALWLLWCAQRSLERWPIDVTGAHTGRLRLGGIELRHHARPAWFVHALVVALRWLITLLVVSEGFGLVFEPFPYTRPWGEPVNGCLVGVVARVGGATLRAVPGLFVAGVILPLAAWPCPCLPGARAEAFKAGSVLVGLMISCGASNLVGQAASGSILIGGRDYRRGENVRIAGHEGTVTVPGMCTARIRTGRGEVLTLSNSLLVASVTKNCSRAVRVP